MVVLLVSFKLDEKIKIEFSIGDSWDDGHGRYENIAVLVNYPIEHLQKTYVELATSGDGIDFSKICCEHEDNSIGVGIFIEAGIDFDSLIKRSVGELKTLKDYDDISSIGFVELCPTSFVELLLEYIKTEVKDLDYEIVRENNDVFNFNLGRFGKVNNPISTTFGYGLFSY